MGFLDGFRLDTLLKRVCKSLLKKRLGDLILGDLDLDQFDIQLGRGTLQLNDLALNTEFINLKLSASPIMLKEGSIKSLLIRFAASCEIIVEELELVLAPSVASEVADVHMECSVSGSTSDTHTSVKTQRNESDSNHNQCSTSVSRDVDEGVKRIANAVKWFLTSFNIKLKNVYVVFDPQTSLDSRLPEANRSLVFRIKMVEFGTQLGLFKLDNFLTFHEAVLEFLKMDDVDALLQNDPIRGAADVSACHSTTAVLAGPIGGFSGKLNLSIPWNKGCLNFEKIDADVSIDSLELRLQISSVRWIMNVWDSLQRKSVDEQDHAHTISNISISSSRSALCPPASSYLKPGSDSAIGTSEYLAQSTFSQSRQDKIQGSFLTRAHVITDWMEPVAHEDQDEPDSDCDESIDQFFECFEELRNSQSSLGNSGIWDWTCSVFNAISFASTLASGSDQVPKEPVVEKTLRASIAEVSVLLFFGDDMDIDNSSVPASALDDMRNSEMFSSCLSSQHFEKSIVSPAIASTLNMHHLKAKCEDIHLDLQTYPKKLRFKASIAQMKLDEYYRAGNNNSDDPHLGNHFLNNNLRQRVQASLPQFPFVDGDHSETYELCGNSSSELTKVELLKSFGECTFHYDDSTIDQDGNSVSSTSMSMCLAPFVFWVHFHTVHMLLSFISEVESDFSHGEHIINTYGDENGSKLSTSTNVSSSGSLKIQISLSPARVILCFPSEFSWDLSHPSVLDTFLVIDHTSYLNMAETASHPQNEMLNEFHLGKPCTSIHLAVGNFDTYLVKPANDISNGRVCSSRYAFSTMKIFSASGVSCYDSGITLIRRKYPVTGPEMVSKAWGLPKLHDQKITKKHNNKWAGISPSTTQDLEETRSSMLQELRETTEFLFHVQLSCVSVQVSKKDCKLLSELLGHVLDGISNKETSKSGNHKDQSVPINSICMQTSVIFECSTLEICTELDETVEVGPLLQAELEGSWNSIKLKISKLSLFSFSNIGGLRNASFLWLNHGEGELWGSVNVNNDKVPEECKHFLIVSCKDSACRRGDGEGTNVLSIGTAGCSVTHIRNPNLQENYTSVEVQSGTIVAPGGRLDWINAICLLFSSDLDATEKSHDNNMLNSSSQSVEPYLSSFFLELADVAVCYEPHFKNSALNAEATDRKFFSCLLAASSFKLNNKSASASSATDFDIQLRDLGLLISESSGSRNVSCGYGVDYLRRAGYAKVAQNTFIEASLRVSPSFWKLEISDSQFDIGTCHDTTYGLLGLGSQLQQLYGPDMRDALDHLQSRWNSVQQANKQNVAADASDKSESSLEILADSGDYQSDGLLDDIIENAFYTEDCMDNDFWERNCNHSFSSSETDDGFELNTATSHILLKSTPEANVTQIPLEQSTCPDQIIDSYYMPEFHQSLSTPCNEEHKCTSGDDAHRTLESEDAGWYNNVPLTIVENHVRKKKNKQVEQTLQQESVCTLNPDEPCNLKGKVHIHGIDVKWRMYAGNDWLLPRRDSTSFTCTDGRDSSSSLEFTLTGLSIQVDMYPDGDVFISKLFIAAQDLTLCDQSIHAPWKLVLGGYNSKDYPRESCSSAFSLELESVRPEPQAPLEDYRFHLEILPVQLHLDQEQLNFLIHFFQNDSCNNVPHSHCENEIVDVKSTNYGSDTVVDEALLPFFQKFDVKPLVLHINYIPRQFDPVALGKGNYAELLNILPWKGIDLKLKHVSAMGVYGWNSIGDTVAAEWLEDISKNQVHKLLKGLPPIRSLVAVGSGTKKLVSLPIKSYKKDRKLLKGMQRGAVAFIRSVTIEAVGLGVHLAAGAHDMLVKTECALTAVPPPLASCEAKRTKHNNIRANQPESAQQGMKQAYESLTDGFGRTASALIGNPIKVYNRGAGAGSALATAICGAPVAAVAPVSASARALHYALLGLRNSLDPEHKKESMYKYQGPSQA